MIQPTRNNIIAKPKDETKTSGGLIIQTKASATMQAVVVAVGPTCEEVTVGDTVYFTEIHRKEMLDGDEFYALSEKSVYAYERADA